MRIWTILLTCFLTLPLAAAEYWQQDVDYHISATLDDEKHTLTGVEHLTYTNHSPDTLHFIWLHLYPNAYRDDHSLYAKEKRAAGSTRFHFSHEEERGYIRIDRLCVEDQPLRHQENPDDGTSLQVFLPQPLLPNQQITLQIDFFVKLPIIFSRLGHNGQHYEISQWYPKMVVYDRFGWHPDGYHNVGEFYGEFGTFDVELTVPKDLVIAATGTLISPQEEIDWMNELAREGATLDSLRAADSSSAHRKIKRILQLDNRNKSDQVKTIRYVAEKVHDFVWCADRTFILKRGRYQDFEINIYVLPKHEAGWKDAIQYVQNTLKLYGEWFMPFPYPQQSVVDGDMSAGGGMEYPMLTIITTPGDKFTRFLEAVIMHEVGHNWFYGILANDEMAEAWLDEGMNSFAEKRYMRTLYGQEGNMLVWGGKTKLLPSFSDDQYQQLIWYITAANRAEKPLATTPFEMEEIRYASMVYSKGAYILDMLYNRFGEETFNRIMQTYFERWRFKHPTTADFQRIVQEISGEEMDEFFRQWVYETKTADLKIKSVKKNRQADGTSQFTVNVENSGDAHVLADVTLETRDGAKLTQRWDSHSPRLLNFNAASLKAVAVDPTDAIPEINNWNNFHPRRVQVRPFVAFPPFDKHLILIRPTVWYDDDRDGLRPGIAINGSNWRTLGPTPGFHEWKIGGSYGIDSRQWNYHLGYSTHFSSNHHLYRLQTDISDLEGRVRSTTRISTRLAKSPFTGSALQVEAGWRYHRLYNLRYWEERAWSLGTVSAAMMNLEFNGGSLLLKNKTRLSLQAGSDLLSSDFDYKLVQITSTVNWRIARWLKTDWRFYGGIIDGQPALQDRFYLYGGVEPQGPLSPLVDGRGRYSAHQRLQLPEEGGGLRGYYGRFLSGNRITSLNFELSMPNSLVKLFFDAGNVWEANDSSAPAKWRYDAGIRVNIGPLALHFPFWISDPLPGEDALEFRWLISLPASSITLGI